MPARPAAAAVKDRYGQVLAGAFVALIGVAVLVAGAPLAVQAGYAGVGPGALPKIVGIVLTLLGLLLTWQAWSRGFDGVDEAAERALGFDRAGFAWISGAILAYGLLIERIGFVFASTLLFVMVARGFRSSRLLRDLLIGLVLAAAVYAIFAAGLKIALPAGWLAFLLPAG